MSLRNVGAALDAGPMRLYGHVSTKEQLLELMVDAIYGEMVPTGRLRGHWRKALRSMARRTRKAAHEHPWFVDLLGGRPRLGPNALAYLEASLASLSGEPGFDDIDQASWPSFDLTTYSHPIDKMADQALKILLEESKVQHDSHVVVEGELKCRGSTRRA